MSVNGVNNNNIGNMYNSIFGNGGTVGTGSGYTVSDYSMISNGSYRKLMKAYYKKDDAEDKTVSKEDQKKANIKLTSAKNLAATLNNSLEDFRSDALYQATGVDDEGKNIYDQDKLAKAVKSFADGYNSFIKSAQDQDSVSLLRKTTSMVQSTSKNATMLSKLGITINEDNTLKIDEEKLKKASVHDVSSLFTGMGSYGDHIQHLARESYKVANSESYAGSGSSYNNGGSYMMLGKANAALDRYL